MSSDDEFLKQFNELYRREGTESVGDPTPEEMEARRRRDVQEREVRIVGVYEHPRSGPFVRLRDTRGRNLPIWIGPAEAVSIQMALDNQTVARPMTHDLLRIVAERLGASVDMVLIDDLYNNVFYAKLVVRQAERTLEIDCRPSDAIALAVRFRAPIYVAEAVLEEGQHEFSEE